MTVAMTPEVRAYLRDQIDKVKRASLKRARYTECASCGKTLVGRTERARFCGKQCKDSFHR